MEFTNQLTNVEDRIVKGTRRDELRAAQIPTYDAGGNQTPLLVDSFPVSLLGEVQRNIVLLLAPMAPYLAHELWEMIGEDADTLLRHPWPKYDPALAAEDEIEIPVQVNGKLRGLVVVPAGATDDQIKQAALANEKVRAALAGKQVAKVIVVPKKLVNVVVR